MTRKNQLSLIALLFSILACTLPGSAPAEPTVNPLPPTPNLPVSSSNVPQATNIPAALSSVRDEFDGKLAPGSGWTWLRQDPSTWSLTASPGWLRINLSVGGYLNTLPANVLIQPVPQGDFELSTLVKFSPTGNFELAGLIILFDEKSVLQFGRGYCDLGACVGSGYYFDNLQNGSVVGGNFGTQGSNTQSILRLVRQGNTYTASYQVDGVTWVNVGSHSIDRQPISIGLIAAQAQSAGNYAEFDWFEVAQP